MNNGNNNKTNVKYGEIIGRFAMAILTYSVFIAISLLVLSISAGLSIRIFLYFSGLGG